MGSTRRRCLPRHDRSSSSRSLLLRTPGAPRDSGLRRLDKAADGRAFLLLICFAACIEGLFFYGAFACVHFLRSRGLLNGLASETNWVFRSESMHMAFAFDVVGAVRAEEPELFDADLGGQVRDMLAEAVECEAQFTADPLGDGIPGIEPLRLGESAAVHGAAGRPGTVELPTRTWESRPSGSRRNGSGIAAATLRAGSRRSPRQAAVGVGGEQLDAGQPAGCQVGEERQPPGTVLGGGGLQALHSSAYVLRYWDAPPWSERARAELFIAACRQMADEGTGVRLAIDRVSDGAFIGWCSLTRWKPDYRSASLGYCLDDAAWGHGTRRRPRALCCNGQSTRWT